MLIAGSEGQLVRLICVPKFSETGVAVMVSSKSHTLNVNLDIVRCLPGWPFVLV